MSETNGTGVQYPTIELNGRPYDVKFTRAALYRMEKAGISFRPQFGLGGKTAQLPFSNIVDVLKLTTDFEGDHEELAEAVFDRRDEAASILLAAWGNLMLPSLSKRAEAAAKTATAPAAQQPVQ